MNEGAEPQLWSNILTRGLRLIESLPPYMDLPSLNSHTYNSHAYLTKRDFGEVCFFISWASHSLCIKHESESGTQGSFSNEQVAMRVLNIKYLRKVCKSDVSSLQSRYVDHKSY